MERAVARRRRPKSAKQVSYWEMWPGPAGRAPSRETLNKLAFLYHCGAGELLDGEDYSHLDTANLHPSTDVVPPGAAGLAASCPRSARPAE